jgi:ribosomal protein L35
MKTNKSYSKRLKVTKKGKILARKTGQNHFNAKESGNTRRNKKKLVSLNNLSNKVISRFLPNK